MIYPSIKYMKALMYGYLTYISTLDECWLIYFIPQQRLKLQISHNYAVIPENVVSEDFV